MPKVTGRLLLPRPTVANIVQTVKDACAYVPRSAPPQSRAKTAIRGAEVVELRRIVAGAKDLGLVQRAVEVMVTDAHARRLAAELRTATEAFEVRAKELLEALPVCDPHDRPALSLALGPVRYEALREELLGALKHLARFPQPKADPRENARRVERGALMKLLRRAGLSDDDARTLMALRRHF